MQQCALQAVCLLVHGPASLMLNSCINLSVSFGNVTLGGVVQYDLVR